jgi:hypothetical protein
MTDGAIQRDRWGRPLIAPRGGGEPVPYTRTSTFAKSLSDAEGLMAWKVRQAVKGLAMNPALLDPLHDPRHAFGAWGNDALDAVIEAANEQAGSNDSARMGTSIHSLTEWVDLGIAFDRNAEPFAPFMPWVDKYSELTRGLGIKILETERFVVCDELQTAGTYDRLVELPEINVTHKRRGSLPYTVHIPAGLKVIGDIKTGKSNDERPWDTAIQIANYAHSDHFDVETLERTPIDGISHQWGLLIHIPSDGSDRGGVYLLDIAAAWEAAQLGVAVRAWRKSKIITPFGMNHVTGPTIEGEVVA